MKIDEEFNSMVYDSILPCIAQAFASLEKGVTSNRLKIQNNNPQVVVTEKAHQMKLMINNYIDGQARIMNDLFNSGGENQWLNE